MLVGSPFLVVCEKIAFPRHPRRDATATLPATGSEVPQVECSEHPVTVGGGDMIAGDAQRRRTHQYMSCGWHWVLSSLSLFAGDFSCSMDPPLSLGTNVPSCPGLTGCFTPSAHRYCEQGHQEHTANTLRPIPEAFTEGSGRQGTPWYPKIVTTTSPSCFSGAATSGGHSGPRSSHTSLVTVGW